MRIAFVGKGGSGKTTLSALFALYVQSTNVPLLVVDADINMHLQELLGIEGPFPKELHLSHPVAMKDIQTYLKGTNEKIKALAHFRKTTPPATGSQLISLADSMDTIITRYSKKSGSLSLMVVGTYDTDDIGASCYHNNLAIFENILSHLLDANGVVVADMVAGVDAFANTLHAQFDLLVLVVEPTKRGIEVFNQYKELATEAGVYGSLCVVGNKVRNEADMAFIQEHVPKEKLLGFVSESPYLRIKEQEGGVLDISKIETENRALLETIFEKLKGSQVESKTRLAMLWDLHRKYVHQAFIKERFGDLTTQIDTEFEYSNHDTTEHTK